MTPDTSETRTRVVLTHPTDRMYLYVQLTGSGARTAPAVPPVSARCSGLNRRALSADTATRLLRKVSGREHP